MSAQHHLCPVCRTPNEIAFSLSPEQPGSYMVLEGEFVGLSDITSRLYCETCDWELKGVLRDLVIDLINYRITAGEFVPQQ